ncbi:gas vesicle accessory protein GvpU [Rossellomorea marisflavi]|uniref:Gas vesicle protein GvpU n=1 Tax=Rossellomorea marisflavi TaxID=189381 RepID=A0A0J5SEQ0_9BACI|nr:gas vesicle accessory protein GvpU [Rossellomorea marisflavi]KMK95800.1 gas vesicle protein GvpU [Rossellomorea marisflavi]KML08466.1 gas vesicle protein GvpU [Rossellomorea marisflavi]KML32467.1 gas vesicle protein GvpU [Rossellomorea marisflavi]KZE48976.1 gas vesicle protein GvpU [Rossellomorea marisflavi]QHA38093.1 gas vesicle protein GvpU [Rossellomorea marisflavi]
MSGHTDKDSILEFFAIAANKHDFSLDITLNLKGAVVTGTMISATEYFSTLSEAFEEGSEVAQKVSEELSGAGEAVEENQPSEANFIHLKNAKVYCGDSKPTPSKGKILWRGKLSEIDGFFLGKISESKSK